MGISSNGKEKTKEAILSNLNEKQAIESRSITTNINDHKLVTKEKTRERVKSERSNKKGIINLFINNINNTKSIT